MTSINKVKKRKRIAILSTLALLLIAVVCFVVGFGISEGWQAVAAWFTSKWATLAVIAVLGAVMALVYAYFAVKDKEDFK